MGNALSRSDLAYLFRLAMYRRALGQRFDMNATDAMTLVEMAMDAHDLAHENEELGAKHLPRWLHRKQAIAAAKADAETHAALEQRRQDKARGYIPPGE